ncbi:hypothetical protein EV122DRAFT_295309 [Schizophyllum commune]
MPCSSQAKQSNNLLAAAPKRALLSSHHFLDDLNNAMVQMLPGCLAPFNPNNDDLDSDPDEPDMRKSKHLEMQAIRNRPLCDHHFGYERLVAPAIEGGYSASSSGGMLLADGASVIKHMHCPGEINGAQMRDLCRIINLSVCGELVMTLQNGIPTPCYPPEEQNNVACRYHIPTVQDNLPADLQKMCFRGMCVLDEVWNTMITGQIWFCVLCAMFFHIRCLVQHGSQIAIANLEEHLGDWSQSYLRLVLHPDRPPALYNGFGVDHDVDKDVNDTSGTFAWYGTTWAELTCLPFCRRMNPGEALQTVETVILPAIKMVKNGHGEETVPDPAEWVRDPEVGGPQAGISATKFLGAKDLRKLRGEDRFHCFMCIGYMKQIT